MSTFRAFLDSVLDTYVPVMASDGTIPSGLAGVDWSYVFAGLLLCIVVWSVFKILGGMICKNF